MKISPYAVLLTGIVAGIATPSLATEKSPSRIIAGITARPCGDKFIAGYSTPEGELVYLVKKEEMGALADGVFPKYPYIFNPYTFKDGVAYLGTTYQINLNPEDDGIFDTTAKFKNHSTLNYCMPRMTS